MRTSRIAVLTIMVTVGTAIPASASCYESETAWDLTQHGGTLVGEANQYVRMFFWTVKDTENEPEECYSGVQTEGYFNQDFCMDYEWAPESSSIDKYCYGEYAGSVSADRKHFYTFERCEGWPGCWAGEWIDWKTVAVETEDYDLGLPIAPVPAQTTVEDDIPCGGPSTCEFEVYASDVVSMQGEFVSVQVVDLDADGLTITDSSKGVRFDLDGDGVPERLAWPAGSTALLVIDSNGNGRIDGLHEVVGSRFGGASDAAALEGWEVVHDLYVASGRPRGARMTAAASGFSKLLLWFDANLDGVSQQEELRTLEAAGIVSVDAGWRRVRPPAQVGGGWITLTGRVHIRQRGVEFPRTLAEVRLTVSRGDGR